MTYQTNVHLPTQVNKRMAQFVTNKHFQQCFKVSPIVNATTALSNYLIFFNQYSVVERVINYNTVIGYVPDQTIAQSSHHKILTFRQPTH